MKRTFLSRRNALFTYSSFSWGGAALAVAILALIVRLLLPNVFWFAVSPAFKLSDALASATGGLFAGFGNAAALAAKNEQLASENAALAAENHGLAEKASDTALLGSGIPAGVVARPPSSPYDVLIVAAGSKAGVAPGMEAFGPGGVPIGIATGVLPDFTRVTLFTSPTMSFDAWVGAKKTAVALHGAGGGAFTTSLPRLTDIAEGDEVYVPAGGALPIGSVTKIDSDPSLPVITVHIQSALNLFSLTWIELRATGPAFVNSLSWKDAATP